MSEVGKCSVLARCTERRGVLRESTEEGKARQTLERRRLPSNFDYSCLPDSDATGESGGHGRCVGVFTRDGTRP